MALAYGGALTGTILSIIASVMTPTLGALFTLLVVSPIRDIRTNQNTLRTISVRNGDRIGEIRVIVDGLDGQMNLLRAEMRAMHAELLDVRMSPVTKFVRRFTHGKANVSK